MFKKPYTLSGMKSWLGRFGTCPYVRCVQKVCSKKIMPERASVGDGVLDVPRYGIHMQHAEQGEELIT